MELREPTEPARPEIVNRLGNELTALLDDGDVLARSVERGDLQAIRQARRCRPTAELVRALLLAWQGEFRIDATIRIELARRHRVDWPTREAGEVLHALAPDWANHPGARLALPGLLVATCQTDPARREQAERIVQTIDANAARSAEARAAIPLLIAALAVNQPASHDPLRLTGLLDRIDRDWSRSPESRAALPTRKPVSNK